MKFKEWLNQYDEIATGSDGVRDNAPVQTAQGTQQAVQAIQSSPKFSDRQTQWQNLSGNTSALNKTFLGDIDWAMSQPSIVPNKIGDQTNAGNVAFKMSLDSPIKGLKIEKPKGFGAMSKMMAKRMQKRMAKRMRKS